MRKILFLSAVFLSSITAFTLPQTVYAKTAAPSAALISPSDIQQKAPDNRVQILRAFLAKNNSPLEPYAQTFIDEADRNNLDWKLVAAISGVESGFGREIPAESYNGWGFGIYGTNVRYFSSWDEGISVVSDSLRKDYMDKWGAKNIYEIGHTYAASPTWAQRVQGFMDTIGAYQPDQVTSLTLSL